MTDLVFGDGGIFLLTDNDARQLSVLTWGTLGRLYDEPVATENIFLFSR